MYDKIVCNGMGENIWSVFFNSKVLLKIEIFKYCFELYDYLLVLLFCFFKKNKWYVNVLDFGYFDNKLFFV